MVMRYFPLMIAVVALVGCGKKESESPTVEFADPIVEKAIREELENTVISNSFQKFTGELTKADLEKVIYLDLSEPISALLRGGAITTFHFSEIGKDGEIKAIPDARRKELERIKLKELGIEVITDASLKDVAMLQQLEILHLGRTQITAAGFKELVKLQKLEQLSFSAATKIPAAGFKELAKLQKLEWLDLGGTEITEAVAKELVKLQKLKGLNLMNTQITDEGLKEVVKMQKLEGLDLMNTHITDVGL